MKILISGYRGYTDVDYIKSKILAAIPKDCKSITIIHGGCPSGVDLCVSQIAKEMGYQEKEYKANWSKYGLAAGPLRNKEMLTKESPDLVLIFLSQQSKGTKQMLSLVKKTNIKYYLYEID